MKEKTSHLSVVTMIAPRGVKKIIKDQGWRHHNLTVATGSSTWGIHSSIDTTRSFISSASAGTSCPTSPSASISKKNGRTSWKYAHNGWHDGNILVSCSNCDDIFLHAEHTDSLRPSYQTLPRPGIYLKQFSVTS